LNAEPATKRVKKTAVRKSKFNANTVKKFKGPVKPVKAKPSQHDPPKDVFDFDDSQQASLRSN
jgi:hypothetical protein